MKYVYIIARVLLGVMFIVFGLNVFLLFLSPPDPSVFPKNALAWNNAMFQSHYVYVTGGSQAIAGLLVLLNRYTGLALIVMGAVLVNIFTFHLAMWPQTIAPAFIVLALWIVTCWPLRRQFAAIFAARIPTNAGTAAEA